MARAALIAFYSFDTRVDRSMADAARRAAPLLTDAFRAQVLADSGTTSTSASWKQWTAADAWATATADERHDDRPPDSAVMAFRQYGVWTTVVSGNGKRLDRTGVVAFVQLIRDGLQRPWRVASVTVR